MADYRIKKDQKGKAENMRVRELGLVFGRWKGRIFRSEKQKYFAS
jgi:hypothetical protein